LKQPVKEFKPRSGIDARQRVGPNRSRSEARSLLTRQEAGLASKPHIAMSSNPMEVTRCGSPAEEYALKFAAETEALSSQNTFFGKKTFDEATT